MKLLGGDKIWWCILPCDLQHLFNLGYTIAKLTKLSIQQILQIDQCYLWGKIYVSRIID